MDVREVGDVKLVILSNQLHMNGEGEAKVCRLGDLGRQYYHQESRLSQRKTRGYDSGGR